MKISISESFTFKKLLRYALSSIVMMIFTSIYGVVDGIFVSNFVGKTAFTAVNFIMPFCMILGTVGFMFGTGESALISKTMGEGDKIKANRIFSLLVYTAILMGAKDQLLKDCVLYARVVLIAVPAFILQYAFQSFFVAAEKPHIGLGVTICAGVTNIICDALFLAVFKWGLVGAAAATALSQCVGGIIPILYFSKKNTSLLQLGKAKFDKKGAFKNLL